jgi:hypothetical protein
MNDKKDALKSDEPRASGRNHEQKYSDEPKSATITNEKERAAAMSCPATSRLKVTNQELPQSRTKNEQGSCCRKPPKRDEPRTAATTNKKK